MQYLQSSLEEKYNFDKRYASILRLNNGEWEYVARGVRNTRFDWHPETNNLYFGDNGRDWMGDDMPVHANLMLSLMRIPSMGIHTNMQLMS